jgi:hypothetical protein
LAIAVLLMLFLRAYRDSTPMSRPFTIALLSWGVAQMFYANFRIVAVPFALALAFVRIYEPPPRGPTDEDEAEVTQGLRPFGGSLRAYDAPFMQGTRRF